jgi:hypothetical protein
MFRRRRCSIERLVRCDPGGPPSAYQPLGQRLTAVRHLPIHTDQGSS